MILRQRHIVLLFIAFFFQISKANDKSKIDSLKRLVATTKSDSIYVWALLEWDDLIYRENAELDEKLISKVVKRCKDVLVKNRLTKSEKHYFNLRLANAYNSLGAINWAKGDVIHASEYYTNALRIHETIQNHEGISTVLGNLGIMYMIQQDFKRAQNFFSRAMKIQKKKNDVKGLIHSYISLGNVLNHYSKYDSSLIHFNQAKKLSDSINYEYGKSLALGSMASIYLARDEFDIAIRYFNQAIELDKSIQNAQGVSTSLANLCSIKYMQGKYKESIEFGLEAVNEANKIGYAYGKQIAYSHLFQAYKASGNYQKALESFDKYVRYKDSLSNEESKQDLIKKEFNYTYEKKAAADSIKRIQEKKIIATRLKEEKTFRYGLYVWLSLTFIFGVFMFNRFRVAKKQKSIIELQKALVEQQKMVVEKKQMEVMDSIYYAKRIQQALLPSEKSIDKTIEKLKNK